MMMGSLESPGLPSLVSRGFVRLAENGIFLFDRAHVNDAAIMSNTPDLKTTLGLSNAGARGTPVSDDHVGFGAA